MTSSTLTGDRRYAPARRGGMTSLGKIAVPKPINLPSQRLENHGLDPNVEIVPKGTHSWGTRSSSSTPNAWGSSTLSPNTDGGSGSPSHLSGRPSSGGSGTRPSTASSDRTHDPIASAWGTNSRPSSASGALTSNQTSFTSLRPCSAETRPGSSQLSRFAEPLSDNSAAWVATGTAEKLGGTSSKNEGFSLTSGDFPTLGSEKENSGKNTESQDHDSYSRPGSSSGGVAPGKESAENSAGDASLNTNAKMEPANSWRRENPMCGEDGLRPSMEKWHPDHQLYPNSNIRPQNYDSWHAPPVNNPPGGVWYRGPPGGPPFAPPIAPGGFPMEPFPYYCPQIPPTALANPQQGPPPGPGPRGSHPTNGDMYRPHMHDAFMRPGMPFRPGFYPGPVPYEGYYASHMGYCNSNDRDIQFMGMAVGPAPYNRFSGQNAPDPGNSHGRPGGYGPPSGHTMVPEQLESGHPQDTRGPCKVLLRQHDGLEGKDKEQKWDDMMATNASYPGKADHQRKSSWENGWSADEKNNKERNTRRMGEEFSSEAKGNQGGVKVKPLEHVGNWKAADDSSVKKLEHAASGFPEVSTAPKDPSLIRKIEGLNAKARASDGRQEVKFASGREEHKNRLQGGNARSNHSANEAGNSYASLERTHVCGISDTASHEDHIFAADKSHEVTGAIGTASSRRSTHGMHGRPDHHGKGRFSTQEAEGWRRRSHVADLPSVLSSSHFESSNVHRQDHNPTEATEKSGSYHQGKDDGESVLPHPDPSDSQSAKMKELAIQRVKQREKEEEERARDQKAKALAKLAELLEEERARDNESVIPMVDNTNVQFHRRSTHGMHGRPDHHGKGRFSTQEAEGWRRRSHVADLPSVLSSSHFESSNVHRQDHNPTEATEKSGSYHQGKDDGESVLPHPDPSDSQRAKMKELAIQRVKQREKEEEERARDQKAKALAKLAELNKRTKAAESLSELLPGMPKATRKESVVIHDQLEPLQQEACRADGDHPDNAPETYDNRASKQKRVSYRQKLNGPLEKTCNDKLMTSIIEAPKNVTDVAANAPVSIEGANEMTTSPESTLPINPTATTESSVHHGRRKNKNGKKYKVEEASSMAVVVTATLSKEITAIDISVESSKSKASESVSDPSAQTDSRDGNQSLDQHTSSPNEEVQGRVNNQWKSQYSRRMPRNPQANKSTEKFQSGDAVIWAPVRSHNKIEATDEASQKTLADAISEPMKSDQQVQNNTRNKRAEMERYIPKSVAKEMAQQGSSPHSAAPLINQITPDETVGRPESRSLGNESSQSSATGMGKVVSILESKNGDGRQNKSGKRYGSWRQRGSSESTMFFTSKNVQKSIEHQVQKPDVSSAKEQLGHSDEWSDSDGWNIPEKSEVPITVPAIKDHGATARGRRQSYRGNKGMGCSHDPDEKIINTGDAEKVHVQTLGSEMHQADSAATSKENRAVGERPASHWQPKSQPISATNHPGSRASGGQNTGSEVARGNKKDSTSQNGMPVLPQPDKDIAAEAQAHPDGSLSARSNLEEDPSTGHQEGKKERKIASHKGHPAEPSPLNMDFQQRVSSGFRKNGNQNSRFGREHDSRGGEWGGSGKDNEHHNRERQRQNSHYEYQPVGPQYNNKANNYESSKDGSHNSVARSRERGQSHSRRGGGNSHGRQPGGARVDANYD